MNVLRAITLKSKLPKTLICASRSAAYWNKDWMPGPLPKTPEERAAAAKKYNLLPEEYDVYEDGSLGDYPKLPLISVEHHDPYYNWDTPVHRKDVGEPMHEKVNFIGEDRLDVNLPEHARFHPVVQTLCYIVTLLVFCLPVYYFHDKTCSLPHMKRHLPIDGKHYKYPPSNYR